MMTQINEPLVSICVLTYNSGVYIIDTLDSIKNQTYQNIELIISDDASTDDTLLKSRQWLLNNSKRFVNSNIITVNENTGIPANYNRAVKSAKGCWIKTFDGDDELLPTAIQDLMDFSKNNKEARFIHAKVREYDQILDETHFMKTLGGYNYPLNIMKSPALQKEVLIRDNRVYTASMIMHKEIFQLYGYFREEYKGMEDFPFLLNLLNNGVYLFFLNKEVAKYRRSVSSVQNIFNFGGLYHKTSVAFFYQEKYKYFNGLELLIYKLENAIKAHILYSSTLRNSKVIGVSVHFIWKCVSKLRIFITNKKISRLISINNGSRV